MSSATNGKNIMLRINPKFLIEPFLLGLILLNLACSSKTESDSDADTSTTAETTVHTEEDKIEATMNEAMDRLRFKDKSFLYDNEFAYYREKYTFDYYLTEVRIQSATADTLEHIEVLSVTYFGEDSLTADINVHFKGPTGAETVLKEIGVPLYWHEGKWIKPTVSNVIAQREYDAIIEKAKSASESEKQGSGK